MQDSSKVVEHFKQCPLCQKWFSDKEILSAAFITPIGMLIDSKHVDISLFFFNHSHGGCGTTFAINTENLAHLIDETIPDCVNTLEETCEGHCVDIEDTHECSQNCKWTPYRRLLRAMLEVRNMESTNMKDMIKQD